MIGLFNGFLAGRFDAGFEIGAGLRVDGELARKFVVNGIEPPGGDPLGGEVLHGGRRRHDFTIQLGTSRLKRAATRVLPG